MPALLARASPTRLRRTPPLFAFPSRRPIATFSWDTPAVIEFRSPASFDPISSRGNANVNATGDDDAGHVVVSCFVF